MKPKIEIDKDAIRFEWGDGGVNLFFDELFRPIHYGDWHRELLNAIKKSYDICVKENIEPLKRR